MFKIYSNKTDYNTKLKEINLKMGFPSKDYSKIISGKRKYFVSDKVMTRTWANESPIETKEKKLILSIPIEYEKDFTKDELVEYDKNWYPDTEMI